MIKQYRHLVILIVAAVLTVAAYAWFIQTPNFESFQEWARSNFVLFFGALFVIKIIGIVWPPVPGGVLTIGAIPIIGWFPAYMADFLGSMTGSIAAYFLARRWGMPFLEKIFDESVLQKIKSMRPVRKHEIEAIFLFRLFGVTVLELVCYAAGLFRVRFHNFLTGSVLSHAVIGIPFFYFTGGILGGENVVLSIIAIIVFIFLVFFLRKRYISMDSSDQT